MNEHRAYLPSKQDSSPEIPSFRKAIDDLVMPASWPLVDPDRAHIFDASPQTSFPQSASPSTQIFTAGSYAAPVPTRVVSPVDTPAAVPSASDVIILDTDDEQSDMTRKTDDAEEERDQKSTHSSDKYYDSSHENACLEYIRLEGAREDAERLANTNV